MVLDASVPMSRQDYRVASLPFENGRSVVFVWNKWDLVAKSGDTAKNLIEDAADHLPDFAHAPSVFVSALTAQRVSRIMAEVVEVYDSARRELPEHELDELLAASAGRRSHPSIRGKLMRFWGMRQVGVAPPTFIVYCNMPNDVTENYRRYLRNRIRERFGFKGAPIRVLCRRR
jgi:GTP-binding protein